ncbi:Exosc8 [Symbiodinium microadriaticum]|nr:Exosc8 [Symbiodinium microadriaticum]
MDLQRGSLSSSFGSASLRLGRSAVLAGVRAEVMEAAQVQDQPLQGRIDVSVEFPPLASPLFRDKHRTQGLTTFLATTLTDVLNSPGVFDPAQLSVRKGEVTWVLHLHIICLNYDGNAFDLCLLAAVAALEDTRLPALVQPAVEAGRLMVAGPEAQELASEARGVTFLSRPLPATFAQMPGGQWVLDPCAVEEGLGASASLCNVNGSWLVFHQGGGADANRFLEELMPVARGCADKLSKLLEAPAE